jgi:glycosyltransferase involved in cell wall biosynthesis
MNEAGNVANVVREIRAACAAAEYPRDSIQLVFVDDGSTDGTGAIVERLASEHPNALCVHHPRNRGFGAAYKSGARAASHDYVLMIPGENSVPCESIVAILSALGKADMVITYPLNPVVRKKVRQLLSFCFQWLTKKISSHDIRYYNGPNLYRRAHVMSALPRTDGHAYQLEMSLKLLSAGRSYVQVGINVRNRPTGRSKALRPKNVARVVWALIRCTVWAMFRRRPASPAQGLYRQPSLD